MEISTASLRKVRRSAFWDGFFSVFTLGFGDYWSQPDPPEWPKLENGFATDAANLARDWKAVGGYLWSAMGREEASRG